MASDAQRGADTSSRLKVDLTDALQRHARSHNLGSQSISYMGVSWLRKGVGGRDGHIAVGCVGWKCLKGTAPVAMLDVQSQAVVWSSAVGPGAFSANHRGWLLRGQKEDVSVIRAGRGGPANDLLAVGYGDGSVVLWDSRVHPTRRGARSPEPSEALVYSSSPV